MGKRLAAVLSLAISWLAAVAHCKFVLTSDPVTVAEYRRLCTTAVQITPYDVSEVIELLRTQGVQVAWMESPVRIVFEDRDWKVELVRASSKYGNTVEHHGVCWVEDEKVVTLEHLSIDETGVPGKLKLRSLPLSSLQGPAFTTTSAFAPAPSSLYKAPSDGRSKKGTSTFDGRPKQSPSIPIPTFTVTERSSSTRPMHRKKSKKHGYGGNGYYKQKSKDAGSTDSDSE